MTVSQNTMSNLLITQLGRQIVWSPCYIPVMDMCQGEASLPLWGLTVLGKEMDIYNMLRFYGENN